MSVKTQTLKGFRDFLPGEALERAWLINTIKTTFEAWGFDPLETPTLEPLELFEGQIGEDEKLFFKFEDPGGRKVALRYDQTVPVCRVVGQYWDELPKPFKRYQIQPAFRAEKPQKGRYREFLQCDADIFGVESAMADAEVIALGLDIYKRVGFKRAVVKINDRALLKDIPYEAIVALDKLAKIGEEGVIKDMVQKGIENGQAKNYLATVKSLEPNDTIKTIFSYLEQSGFPRDWYEFDPTIARSFSYSTGPIWEIVIPDIEGGSVLGGERFDKLVEKLSGRNIPGTGFGLGFDRTLEAAKEQGLVPQLSTNTKVLITIFNQDLLANSIELSKDLRAKGVNAEVYVDPEAKLDKQLKYADKKGIPFVAIIGPEEAEANEVTLKDLQEKSQSRVPVSELAQKLA